MVIMIRYILGDIGSLLTTWDKKRAILDVDQLSKAVQDACGDLTFLEAFDRTGRIINITVASEDDQFPLLLN